jgi:hypothetical protein
LLLLQRLVRQFNFAQSSPAVPPSRVASNGLFACIEVIDLDSQECVTLLSDYIQKSSIWHEDIGEEL